MAQTIDIEGMRDGLRRGEFFLEYLPVVALADGRCTGAEALIRWRRPNGIVLPEEFVPIAENTPLSGMLTYWVIETAAAELGAWLRAHRDASLSINVPPEIVGRGGLWYAAERAGLIDLVPQLIAEVTERGLPDAIAVQALPNYAAAGGRIALDDVTLVGGANLAILARSRIDIIKLDRSLIAQIGPQSPRPQWLEAIAALLRASQLIVIAEGVETEEQADALRAAGIQAAQGYHFSPALPAAEFVAYHGAANGRPGP